MEIHQALSIYTKCPPTLLLKAVVSSLFGEAEPRGNIPVARGNIPVARGSPVHIIA